MPPVTSLRDLFGLPEAGDRSTTIVLLVVLALALACANVLAGGVAFDDVNGTWREVSVQSLSVWLRSQPKWHRTAALTLPWLVLWARSDARQAVRRGSP